MEDDGQQPLHLLRTRLQVRDPTNPGMGPTRYISKNSVKRLDPEETKRRIKEKTERLAADLLKTSLETKKKLNDAYWLHQRELHVYNERVKEKGRLRQAGQLKLGCGKKELPRYVSPFATDLVKVTEESRMIREKKEKRRAKVKQDSKAIRNMQGELEFNLATPELAEVIEKHVVPYKREVGDSGKFKLSSPVQRLSVGRYRTVQDLGVTLQEERSISELQDIELDYAEKKFPVIAMEMEHSKLSKGITFERSRSMSFDQLRATSRGNSAGLSTASWRSNSRPNTTDDKIDGGGYQFPTFSFLPVPSQLEHFPMPTGSITSMDESQDTVYKTGGQLDIDSVDFSNIISNDGIVKNTSSANKIGDFDFNSINVSESENESTTVSGRPKSREDFIYDVILSRNAPSADGSGGRSG